MKSCGTREGDAKEDFFATGELFEWRGPGGVKKLRELTALELVPPRLQLLRVL